MREFTVERLGHQGDGIVEGPLFVAGVLPGEVITGTVEKDRIVNPSIVTPSSDRVKPPCSHARSCGGCGLQHASDDFVANFKKSVVANAFKARGIDTDIDDVVTSPVSSRRRAVFSGRRTKKGALVGFHMKGSDTVIAIPKCTVLRPALLEIIPFLEMLTVAGATRKGAMRFAVTETMSGIDIHAEGGKPADGALLSELAQMSVHPGVARLTWDDEPVAAQHTPVLEFAGYSVTPPAGAFLQATKEGEDCLVSSALETVSGAKKVLDLFSGCGTFSLPAAKNAEVHAVEGDKDMVTSLTAAWRMAHGLKTLTAEARDLFRRPLLPDELNRFDAIIIDPPRAGAEAQVIEIAKSKVKTIAMVSCNPVSFARDAEVLLKAGFEMRDVKVVDQFRWSSHVEITAGFHR
ncbi:class I SAM-dependent RNA methyltransferase [Halocynthiibacter namhaensis]|uniref:class I SAM-dependent RNA methyltransferase n=1 Tax=Halocynthiibacter namhaensis TaxID=1290553 RepID=UPI00057927C2|nr:RsmD family RNA methyltransferase [Halocynthiibacter namhaensis]